MGRRPPVHAAAATVDSPLQAPVFWLPPTRPQPQTTQPRRSWYVLPALYVLPTCADLPPPLFM